MRIARVFTISLLLWALIGYAFAQTNNTERYKIVSAYAKDTAADYALMVDNSSGEAATAAKMFVSKTDATFKQLAAKKLLDTKFMAYQAYWGKLRPALQEGSLDETTISKLNSFGAQVVKAAKGGDCTVVISASKGSGAIVSYAKAQDAELGRGYTQLPGSTTIVWELEPAEYKFRCFRKGKETGRTDIVKCTQPVVEITIDE